jgi:putative ABC transport system permease protein
VILALASVAVLVGGRLSEQTRRVGLLKAVGATPGTVAAILLIEHLAVTIVAALAGLGLGRLLAPLLTRPSSGLLGTPGTHPSPSPP